MRLPATLDSLRGRLLGSGKVVVERISGCVLLRQLPHGLDVAHDIGRWFPDVATIVDVGANVGQSTVAFAETWPAARIYSVEPFIEAFTRLQRNVSGRPRIVSLQCALGAAPGTARVRLRKGAALHAPGWASAQVTRRVRSTRNTPSPVLPLIGMPTERREDVRRRALRPDGAGTGPGARATCGCATPYFGAIDTNGSKILVRRHSGHFPGFDSRSESKRKPHCLHLAGSITTCSPAARAERIAWRRSSSTSPRRRPSSRASHDVVRGTASASRNCRRRVMEGF